MNLKEYLESDIIDFELNESAINDNKELFSNENGIRSYFSNIGSYFIFYSDKKVLMTGVFESNYKEIKAFKLICENYGFKFEVNLLDFPGADTRDILIQNMKYHLTVSKILTDEKLRKSFHESYDRLINSNEIIEKTKEKLDKYLAFQISTLNIKESVISQMEI